MRNRIGTHLGIAVSLLTFLAAGADADSRNRRTAPRLQQRGEPFTVAGSCTGLSADEVRVDGMSYRLDPDARIYEVGRGFVPLGTSLTFRIISLSGVKVRNVMIVHSVLIRPEFSPFTSAGQSSPVSLADESAPR